MDSAIHPLNWGQGVHFPKVRKLFRHISADVILFVSSKRRRLEAWSYIDFYSLNNISKDQLYRISRT